MARLAKDKEMMNAIANGIDLHRLTASKTALKAMDEVTKEDRQRAKAVNFGLIYGMSAPTLQKYAYMNYGVRMTPDEAVQTRDRYFDLYKGIARWHVDQKTAMYTPRPYNCHSYEKGYYITYVAMQQTLTGRKRFWANYAGETIAKPTEFFNSADQGTSADITKLALVKLYQVLPSEAHIIAAIHDEVLVEVPEDMATMVSEIMLKVLVEAGSDVLFPVKVDAEVEIGDSWG